MDLEAEDGMIHLRAKHWFLLFAAALFGASLWLTVRLAGDVSDASAEQEMGEDSRVILIDPGHGSFDGGAVGTAGTVEKDVNLAIALKLRDMLTQAGYQVVMTRDSDDIPGDNPASSIRSRKIADMRARLNLTRLYPGSTLISIHQNLLAGSRTVRGAQVFYSPNRESSKQLAQDIQDEFNAAVQPQKPREIVKTGKNLYLFYHAQNTAVLCECGFLSHPEEEALLTTEEYQYRLAYCIYRGLLRYDGADTA